MKKYSDEERLEKFFENVEKTEICWFWQGGRSVKGYGQFWNGQRMVYAHRLSFQIFIGPIPPTKVVDHKCRNRACVNPKHLQLVSNTENILLGEGITALQARQTHCYRNHPLEPPNLYKSNRGRRICRLCTIIYKRNRKIRRSRKND